MSSQIRLLKFTKSVGNRKTPDDTVLVDAQLIGKFPFEQKIKHINSIGVYIDTASGDHAVVVGLKVTYEMSDGSTRGSDHGNVTTAPLVNTVTIAENEILLSSFGLFKNLPDDPEKDKRIASIGFTVFNKANEATKTYGPYNYNTKYSLGTWVTSGVIVAFQSTSTPALGLTSLGFTESIEGDDAVIKGEGTGY